MEQSKDKIILLPYYKHSFSKLSYDNAVIIFQEKSQKELWDEYYLNYSNGNTKLMNDYVLLLYISIKNLFISQCIKYKLNTDLYENYNGDIILLLLEHLPHYNKEYEFSTFFVSFIFNLYMNKYWKEITIGLTVYNLYIIKWFNILYPKEQRSFLTFEKFIEIADKRSNEIILDTEKTTRKSFKYRAYYYSLCRKASIFFDYGSFSNKAHTGTMFSLETKFNELIYLCHGTTYIEEGFENIIDSHYFSNFFTKSGLNRMDKDILFIYILKYIEHYDSYTIQRILNIDNKKYVQLIMLYPIVMKKIRKKFEETA